MDEYNIKVVRIDPTKDDPRGAWCASVILRGPGDTSLGLAGHSYIGRTPQIALASLAVFWATESESGEGQSDG